MIVVAMGLPFAGLPRYPLSHVRGIRVNDLGVQFLILAGYDEAEEFAILGLLLELSLVCSTSCRVSHGSFGSGSCRAELRLASQFSLGIRFGTRVADLRGELGLVHFLIDDLRVLTDFSTEA